MKRCLLEDSCRDGDVRSRVTFALQRRASAVISCMYFQQTPPTRLYFCVSQDPPPPAGGGRQRQRRDALLRGAHLGDGLLRPRLRFGIRLGVRSASASPPRHRPPRAFAVISAAAAATPSSPSPAPASRRRAASRAGSRRGARRARASSASIRVFSARAFSASSSLQRSLPHAEACFFVSRRRGDGDARVLRAPRGTSSIAASASSASRSRSPRRLLFRHRDERPAPQAGPPRAPRRSVRPRSTTSSARASDARSPPGVGDLAIWRPPARRIREELLEMGLGFFNPVRS